ncbi:MAG: hypothetical protein JSS98_10310 [Bacteroidetes bacterium]|nr:hypothetical protein [Bacteroidota bacterium]
MPIKKIVGHFPYIFYTNLISTINSFPIKKPLSVKKSGFLDCYSEKIYFFVVSAAGLLVESATTAWVVSAAAGAGAATVESVTTFVESVVDSVLEAPLLHATKNAAAVKTRITFFICLDLNSF